MVDRFKGVLVPVVTPFKGDGSIDLDRFYALCNTLAIIEQFPALDVFAGSEVFLLDTLRAGGMGCITATGSVNVRGIREVYEGWQTLQADALQAKATLIRQTIQKFPMIPAVKAIVARSTGQSSWKQVLPPLTPLDAETERRLFEALEAIGFSNQVDHALAGAERR